jgi:glucosylceramidase
MVAMAVSACGVSSTRNSLPPVEWWLTTEDLSSRLAPQPRASFATEGDDAGAVQVTIDDKKTFQRLLGVGSSLEHSTCYNIRLLPADRQEKVIESLVCPEKGIGMNLMRISIGTPDFTASPWYSYDDRPPGEEDPELKHFSIEKDRKYVLPVLKLALEKNPELRFHAAPWSPPGWMKTNGALCGGRIDPEHFGSFAAYLARTVEAYRAEGIELWALTPQNEPEYFPDTYPTCGWTATQQRDFIRDFLGPLFRERRLKTKIWCYDHNFNHPGFPTTILKDPEVARYVDGTAFHHYEGRPEAMTLLHNRFPDKRVYFTEGSTFGISGAAEIISFLRNWARCYNAWVTVIDHEAEPNPGPHDCSPTCIVLNSETLELTYRFDYWMYGQFSKFLKRGAVRIASTPSSESLPNVAFRNPDGSLVLVAVNTRHRAQAVTIRWSERQLSAVLPPRSIATFRWKPGRHGGGAAGALPSGPAASGPGRQHVQVFDGDRVVDSKADRVTPFVQADRQAVPGPGGAPPGVPADNVSPTVSVDGDLTGMPLPAFLGVLELQDVRPGSRSLEGPLHLEAAFSPAVSAVPPLEHGAARGVRHGLELRLAPRGFHVADDVPRQLAPVADAHPVRPEGVPVQTECQGRVASPEGCGVVQLPHGGLLVGHRVFLRPEERQLRGPLDLVRVVLSEEGHGPDVLQCPAQLLVSPVGEPGEDPERLVRVTVQLPRDLRRGPAGRFLARHHGLDEIGNRDVPAGRMGREGDEALDIVETARGLRRTGRALAGLDVPLEVQGSPVEAGRRGVDHRCLLPRREELPGGDLREPSLQDVSKALIGELRVVSEPAPEHPVVPVLGDLDLTGGLRLPAEELPPPDVLVGAQVKAA